MIAMTDLVPLFKCTLRTVVWEACPTAWGESLLPYRMEVKG